MRVSRVVMSTAAAIALAAVPAVSAHAQKVSPSVDFGVRAGLAVPFSDLSNAVNSGFTVGGTAQITAPAWPVAVRGAVDFTSYGAKVGSGSLRDLGFTVDALLPLSPMGPAPYLVGGIGIHHLSSSNGGNSENDFGFGIGAGYKWSLSSMTAYLEAKYQYVSATGSAWNSLPITFGLTF